MLTNSSSAITTTPEWSLCKELRFKVTKGKVLLYFSFEKARPKPYKPVSWLSIDVNKNSIAVLLEGKVYLLKTGFSSTIKDYFYRRRRIQAFYDKMYGSGNRSVRKRMKRLREK